MGLGSPYRLQLHVVYLAAATALVLLWAAIGSWLWSMHSAVVEGAVERSAALVETLAARTGQLFGAADLTLKSAGVSSRSDLARDPVALHQALRDTAALLPAIRELYLLDATGMMRHSSLTVLPPPLDGSKTPGYLQHRAGVEVFLDEPSPSRAEAGWMLVQSRRISAPDGSFAGVASAMLDLDAVAQAIDPGTLAPGTQVLVARSNVVVASSPAADEQGRPYRGRRAVEMALPVGAGPVLNEVTAGSPWRIANEETIGAAMLLPRLPLVVAAFVPPKAVLGDWRTLRAVLLVLGLLATAGMVFGVLLLRRSIRRQSEAAETLRLYNERYELGVLGTDDGVYDWDLRTGRLYISAAYARLLGLERRAGTIEAEAMSELTHPDDRERLTAALDACLAGRTPQISECYRARHASGRWLWIETKATPARDELGRAIRLVGTARDITERPLVVSL